MPKLKVCTEGRGQRSATSEAVAVAHQRLREMKTLALFFVVVTMLVSRSSAQNEVLSPAVSGPTGTTLTWPHPFLLVGLGVNGGGYSSLSGNAGAGLRIDTSRLIWEATVGYDTAPKTNDNTLGNYNGHSRRIASSPLTKSVLTRDSRNCSIRSAV
jgi:hypothetical protein